jgi:hypothetical protein
MRNGVLFKIHRVRIRVQPNIASTGIKYIYKKERYRSCKYYSSFWIKTRVVNIDKYLLIY